jgi:tRNA A37 threonylcarbamoyladenosine synthetase subunit TsaC/SUA5/YrdC
MPTESTVEAIRAQLGEKASMIDTVVDDGPRIGTPTTVVEIIDEQIIVLREGTILSEDIMSL